MIAKVHIIEGRKMVAVCDKDLLGKKFEEDEMQIDLTGEFYKGEEVSDEELAKMLDGAFIADFVGKKSVEFGESKGLIKKEGIVSVSEIPHAQAFSLS